MQVSADVHNRPSRDLALLQKEIYIMKVTCMHHCTTIAAVLASQNVKKNLDVISWVSSAFLPKVQIHGRDG